MSDKNTQFIKKAIQIHGDKYDYSKVEYVNNNTKVCIICPEHGEFWQTPHNHLAGHGCYKCHHVRNGISKRLTQKDVIERFIQRHGYKYDYSKVQHIKSKEKICIICPEHGEFWQLPYLHTEGQGCPKCYGKERQNTQIFIERARKIHGDKYDYSKVEYVNNSTKVCIICPEHGEFWQTPKHHLDGYGCRQCSNTIMDKHSFILKSHKIHENFYDYSKVEYVNNSTKVCIICPEHGEFWQTPNSHLNGRGCPCCKRSHLELQIQHLLDTLNIKYVSQYRDKSILGRQSIDFYIPSIKIGIECQGEQHFIKNFYKKFGNDYCEQRLEYIKKLDENKFTVCKQNDINIIYFLDKKFSKYMDVDKTFFTKKEELSKYICNLIKNTSEESER